eukprot:4711156-Prymnesium_polylepis.1
MLRPVRESLRRLGHLATLALTSLYFPIHQSSWLKALPMGTPSARIVSPSGFQAVTNAGGAF